MAWCLGPGYGLDAQVSKNFAPAPRGLLSVSEGLRSCREVVAEGSREGPAFCSAESAGPRVLNDTSGRQMLSEMSKLLETYTSP